VDQRRVELGLRSETIRQGNLSAIVRALHCDGPLSRSELGARTGLTRSAIRVLIGELSAAGLVEELNGPLLGTPGRPSAVVRLRPGRAVVLALEVAVDYLAAAIVGIGGQVLRTRRIDRSRASVSVDETIHDLVALANELTATTPVDEMEEVVGIAVAVAGIVRRTDDVVAMAPNMGWRDVPLGALLAKAMGTNLRVMVANEADLGALAEQRRGAGAGVREMLFISGEVGVGGGMIVDGRPMTGATGYGGEIGHMPLNPEGPQCGCGSFGCWELEVGERAVLALAGHRVDGGRTEIDRVLDEARRGDVRALAAFEQVGTWLGRGVAALVNVLNPELVVLGGLFQRVYPFAEPPLRREVKRLTLKPSAAIVHIAPSSLGVDAPLLGAAELAFERLLDDPASLAESSHQAEWRVVA
jgi:predicted NBD/HSP70 family sugar kinase